MDNALNFINYVGGKAYWSKKCINKKKSGNSIIAYHEHTGIVIETDHKLTGKTSDDQECSCIQEVVDSMTFWFDMKIENIRDVDLDRYFIISRDNFYSIDEVGSDILDSDTQIILSSDIILHFLKLSYNLRANLKISKSDKSIMFSGDFAENKNRTSIKLIVSNMNKKDLRLRSEKKYSKKILKTSDIRERLKNIDDLHEDQIQKIINIFLEYDCE